MTKFESMLVERMTVRRWLVTCMAIMIGSSAVAGYVGYSRGSAVARDNVKQGVVDAVRQLGQEDVRTEKNVAQLPNQRDDESIDAAKKQIQDELRKE